MDVNELVKLGSYADAALLASCRLQLLLDSVKLMVVPDILHPFQIDLSYSKIIYIFVFIY